MKRTKTVLKDLTPTIKTILEIKPQTRDDDMLLYCYFLNSQGISKMIPFWELRDKIQSKQLPSLESIGRIRRKVQEIEPQLGPSDAAKEGKAKQECEYREYARDLTEGYGGYGN